VFSLMRSNVCACRRWRMYTVDDGVRTLLTTAYAYIIIDNMHSICRWCRWCLRQSHVVNRIS